VVSNDWSVRLDNRIKRGRAYAKAVQRDHTGGDPRAFRTAKHIRRWSITLSCEHVAVINHMTQPEVGVLFLCLTCESREKIAEVTACPGNIPRLPPRSTHTR
jgi:hypothetical protein